MPFSSACLYRVVYRTAVSARHYALTNAAPGGPNQDRCDISVLLHFAVQPYVRAGFGLAGWQDFACCSRHLGLDSDQPSHHK
jgi:hypothetical protein